MTSTDVTFYRNKRIFLTGHTGFMGSWLTKLLTMLDADICGYSLDPPTQPNMYNAIALRESIHHVRGDIRDKELLERTLSEFKPEIVFHLAAQPIVLESYEKPVETFDTNVTGTVNLLNEIRKINSVKVIIVVTSDKSYRNNEWVYPYRENDVLGGNDPYSASKSCQDIVIDSFRNSYFNDLGIAISSIRAGNVIGGGDWGKYRLIPDIVRGIVNKEVIKIRNPDFVRPWQHVLEPISGMLILANKMYNDMKFSGPWNFGPDNINDFSVRELTERFLEYYGKGSYIIEDKKIFRESMYLQLDNSKAKKLLNWYPKLGFEEAVRWSAEWYRRYYDDPKEAKKVTECQIMKYLEDDINERS